MYICSKEYFNTEGLFEDLIITGAHAILVANFQSDEQREKTNEYFGQLYTTDYYYRLPAFLDQRTEIYPIPGKYTIYHLVLENRDYFMNYGIFANGLLVESCSECYMIEKSQMEITKK